MCLQKCFFLSSPNCLLCHHLWTSLANICSNFMLIKIRLLKQAWLLSHSYYCCSDWWYYKRKGKPCSLLVTVVNFHVRGFLSRSSVLMIRVSVHLNSFSKVALSLCGICVYNMYVVYPVCSADWLNKVFNISLIFSPLPWKSTKISRQLFNVIIHGIRILAIKHKRKWKICSLTYGENPSSLRLFLPPWGPNTL